MSDINTKIAFLAPEIPSLSATFVYNEILNLGKRGIEVFSVSLHIPKKFAKTSEIEKLAGRTQYLYEKGIRDLIKHNLIFILSNPRVYFENTFKMLKDSLKCGIFSRVGVGLIYRFLFAVVLANLIKKEKCSHLHCHFAHVSADIAMYASGLANIPFSFTAHANDIFERKWLLEEKVERSKFAITISNYNKDYLINLGGKSEKIHVVYCGVNPSDFQNPSSGNKNFIPKIGSLGRLVEKKGFDVLIDACKMLKNENINFELEIAGDGPLKSKYENQVVKYGLESNISFIGSMNHNEVPQWLQGLDAFVLACRKDSKNDMDGIPVVLMEAMMSQVPVVSTKISGIPELVKDGETGYLADPENPTSLAKALVKVLYRKKQNSRLCTNAVKQINKKFNLLLNTNSILDYLERVPS
jgi:colanic acid/amylovoran biosynthesis glycosyltransferase